ncbi:MAG: hypothetical protein CVT61_06235 [Actinobacteria bacterium HGW-Actinobacteria-11]|nr:MAG: hypothetical protein CVT61_06235 [Actinobacteria bacterium HGW-Actinobacteria-11]
MSGRRAKADRRSAKRTTGAAVVMRSAEAILAVDMSDVVLRDRVPQVVVGLCRAAAAQSRAVVALTLAGHASSAAPNRRLVFEAAIRLNWLRGLSRTDRRQAADVMLAKDRKDTNSTLAYLAKLGQTVDFDPTEMNEFELDAPTSGSIQEQARKLDSAVQASSTEPWSLYAFWRQETQLAHASGALAGSCPGSSELSRTESGNKMTRTITQRTMIELTGSPHGCYGTSQ